MELRRNLISSEPHRFNDDDGDETEWVNREWKKSLTNLPFPRKHTQQRERENEIKVSEKNVL
jgi:hypothetical protein